jgi:membrane-associated phospholipid phosphatase
MRSFPNPRGSGRSVAILVLLLTMSGASLWAQDQPAEAPAPRAGELPRRILKDTRRLASKTPIITLSLGGALALAARNTDGRVVASLSGSRSAEQWLDAGSGLGNGCVQAGGAAAVYGMGEWLHRPALASLGADLIEAQAVTGVVTQALKVTVNRRRPDGGRHGFPSGHSSASFATAAVLARRFGWRYGSLAYAGAAYVAASRLTERQHYLSDVMFGAAVGVAGAYTLDISPRVGRVTVSGAPLARGVMVTGAWRLSPASR